MTMAARMLATRRSRREIPAVPKSGPNSTTRTTNHGPAVVGTTIIIVHLPTDLTLDVLFVRFPLGVIPKFHVGNLSGSTGLSFVVLFGQLFGTAGLSLLLLLVASIPTAMVISVPPVITCSSGVFVCPLAQLWLILLPSLVAFRPPHVEALSEAGLEPGQLVWRRVRWRSRPNT